MVRPINIDLTGNQAELRDRNYGNQSVNSLGFFSTLSSILSPHFLHTLTPDFTGDLLDLLAPNPQHNTKVTTGFAPRLQLN
jgi:hypothetical protein